MNELLNIMRSQRDYTQIINNICDKKNKKHPLLVTQMCEGARETFIAAVIKDRPQKDFPALCILPSEKEILRLSSALSDFNINVQIYPVRDFIFANISSSHEFEFERLATLESVLSNSCDVVLTTPDAAMQYTVPKDRLTSCTLKIDDCSRISIDDLSELLIKIGYAKVPMVESQGQFSRRGDIIDIYTPSIQNPVRIETFGDEIDRISTFDVISQRRIDSLNEILIYPVREIIFSDYEERKSLADIIRRKIKEINNIDAKKVLSEEAEILESGNAPLSVDKYISLIYPEKQTIIDYFSYDSMTIIQDYNAVYDRMHSYEFQENEAIRKLCESEIIDSEYSRHFANESYLIDYIKSRKSLILNTFTTSLNGIELSGIYSIQARPISGFADNFPLLFSEIENYEKIGYKLCILCDGSISAENLLKILADKGYAASINNDNADLHLTVGPNLAGYEIELSKFAVLSICHGKKDEIKKSKKHYSKSNEKATNAERILSYTELSIGDYVVHSSHGIGVYCGVESLTIDGCRRDFVKLKYAGDDLLYLPCNQLDSLSKYVGSDEGAVVRLSKIGSPDWSKAKAKVKSATKEMAKELIKLYASRMRKQGYSFSKDDSMSQEFADAFEYEETNGQMEAIRDICRDMESNHPMDRLLCGDVGYGKTEVALRAAFKAVQDNKQVAFLVPTTILALQHYQTFVSRMRGFPVTVDMISRFYSPKQQKAVLRKVERGEIDIIIGTHRLLSKDIHFNDLGLVIIDEEQRFGVAQKEKLKTFTENVDVLSLSATPIPRTMNMALSGIRDMSVLEEAPGDRLPVQTYVCEYDDGIINEAIRKELRRGGQVFYLCNRIDHIDSVVAKLADAHPNAKIGVGHGQMDKEDLSDVWRSMLNNEIDILVCTTIIETGVDIPNANTLIVENSDQLGLSQLHQIRGRVGRSSRRAYAYFTYPKNKVLTEVGEKRLEAIRDFTEFGAGFRIAIRDLEIRGAGDLLGADQHGHMITVGYDMYMKLLNEAILEEKGENVKPRTECNVDFGIDAYIPEKYIDNSNQRIEAYKKISLIRCDDDFYDVTDELLDRYGDLPVPVLNLLKISLIRALGSDCNITKIVGKEKTVVLYPEKFNIQPWTEVAAKHNGKLFISLGKIPCITLKTSGGNMMSELTVNVLKEYSIAIKSEETVAAK